MSFRTWLGARLAAAAQRLSPGQPPKDPLRTVHDLVAELNEAMGHAPKGYHLWINRVQGQRAKLELREFYSQPVSLPEDCLPAVEARRYRKGARA